MVENKQATHGFVGFRTSGTYIVHFHYFYRLHITIFCQTSWNAGNLAPPVRPVASHEEIFGIDNQIRLAQFPLGSVIESQGFRGVGRISLLGTTTGPGGNRGNFFIIKRRIILELLDTDIFLDIPGWHGAGTVTQASLVLN